jgi:hypothetical protein
VRARGARARALLAQPRRARADRRRRLERRARRARSRSSGTTAWTFPNLRDSEGTVGNDYHLTGLPTTFVLDARGRIAPSCVGPRTKVLSSGLWRVSAERSHRADRAWLRSTGARALRGSTSCRSGSRRLRTRSSRGGAGPFRRSTGFPGVRERVTVGRFGSDRIFFVGRGSHRDRLQAGVGRAGAGGKCLLVCLECGDRHALVVAGVICRVGLGRGLGCVSELLAAASVALLFWLRNDGIAIAARMPMIRITTRSSISVNPRSPRARCRPLPNICLLIGPDIRASLK